jgi:hypothetical protein
VLIILAAPTTIRDRVPEREALVAGVTGEFYCTD